MCCGCAVSLSFAGFLLFIKNAWNLVSSNRVSKYIIHTHVLSLYIVCSDTLGGPFARLCVGIPVGTGGTGTWPEPDPKVWGLPHPTLFPRVWGVSRSWTYISMLQVIKKQSFPLNISQKLLNRLISNVHNWWNCMKVQCSLPRFIYCYTSEVVPKMHP